MTDQMTADQWALCGHLAACVPKPRKTAEDTDRGVSLWSKRQSGCWGLLRRHPWEEVKVKITAFLSSWGVPEERVDFGLGTICFGSCGVGACGAGDRAIAFFSGTHDLDGEPVKAKDRGRCEHCCKPLGIASIYVEGKQCCSVECAKKYEEHLHPLVTIQVEPPKFDKKTLAMLKDLEAMGKTVYGEPSCWSGVVDAEIERRKATVGCHYCREKVLEQPCPLCGFKGEADDSENANHGVTDGSSRTETDGVLCADSPTPTAWQSDAAFFGHSASDAEAEAYRVRRAFERVAAKAYDDAVISKERTIGWQIKIDDAMQAIRDQINTDLCDRLDAQAEGGGR